MTKSGGVVLGSVYTQPRHFFNLEDSERVRTETQSPIVMHGDKDVIRYHIFTPRSLATLSEGD
jgi:hypothetical protein